MDPADEDQVTPLFEAVPRTLAEKEIVPPAGTVVETGVMVTDVTPDPVEGAGEVGEVGEVVLPGTVTSAEADLVGSATLVAVTVPTPPAVGAVNRPELETLPRLEVQVTAVFVVVPWMLARN